MRILVKDTGGNHHTFDGEFTHMSIGRRAVIHEKHDPEKPQRLVAEFWSPMYVKVDYEDGNGR